VPIEALARLQYLTGLTVVINLTNLVFVFVGLQVLLAAIRDVRFDAFLIYAAMLVQYVSELEANFNKGQESPAHPDKEIADGFASEMLDSLDKEASEFWRSMRPYFLAYVARGPALGKLSFTSPVERYIWGKSSSRWEDRKAWLDLDLSEAWRRRSYACAAGSNDQETDAQMCKNVLSYVKESLANDRFSDAAAMGVGATFGGSPLKHFFWEVLETTKKERAFIDKGMAVPEAKEVTEPKTVVVDESQKQPIETNVEPIKDEFADV